jgi:mRNA interferase HicA
MKRTELIRELREAACVLLRHGARHDVYLNPATGQRQPGDHPL